MRLIDSRNMGRGKHGWLDSHFHFSFAEYYNPGNMQFGVLRVLNDDTVAPGTGFGPHAHADMEILSYVIDGELTHADSMGNERTLTRGQVQYMSAGTGYGIANTTTGKNFCGSCKYGFYPTGRGMRLNTATTASRSRKE